MIACEHCKKPIDDRICPAQVLLLPPGRSIEVVRSIQFGDITRFCTVECLRRWAVEAEIDIRGGQVGSRQSEVFGDDRANAARTICHETLDHVDADGMGGCRLCCL